MISSSSDVKAPLLYLTFTQQSIVGGKQLFHWHVLAALCWLPLYHKFIWQQTCFNVLSSSLMMLRVYMLRTNTASVVLELWTFCSQKHRVPPSHRQTVHMFTCCGNIFPLTSAVWPSVVCYSFSRLSYGCLWDVLLPSPYDEMNFISAVLSIHLSQFPPKNKWIKSVAGFSLRDGGNHLSERKWRVKTQKSSYQKSSTLSKHNSRYLNLS